MLFFLKLFIDLVNTDIPAILRPDPLPWFFSFDEVSL